MLWLRRSSLLGRTWPWRSPCIGCRMSWGIGMGYHRLHTHRGYKVPKPLEYFLAICATLALEGGPIYWVAAHRCHHQHSDTDHDPHTPRHGGFWGAHGLDTVRRVDAFQHGAGGQVRSRSRQGSVLPSAQRVALGPADSPRYRDLAAWRCRDDAVGHSAASGRRLACDLAGQLGHAHVGRAPVPHPR